MGQEQKSVMLSARLPKPLVERLDYVARNTDSDNVKNRSTALRSAIEAWLPGQEQRLTDLGILQKKARSQSSEAR